MQEKHHQMCSLIGTSSTSGERTGVVSDFLSIEDGERSIEHFEDETLDEDLMKRPFPLSFEGDGLLSLPTPCASDLIDLSEASSKGSFEGIGPPKDSCLMPLEPLAHILDQTIRESLRNGLDRPFHEDGPVDLDDEVVPFNPPILGRPVALTSDDRCITPQSWQNTQQPSLMFPQRLARGLTQRFLSAPVSPRSPMTLRTTRSETYFHTYEADPKALPQPVPPFVVVHSTGHAFVKVKPNGNDSRDFFQDEDQGSTASSTLSWRSWIRPIGLLIAGSLLVLACVLVVAGLIRDKQLNASAGDIKSPTEAPVSEDTASTVLTPATITSPEHSLPPDTGLDPEVPITDTVTEPNIDMPSPTVETAQTVAPTVVTALVPSSVEFSETPSAEEELPWNNYVIGLLAVESPDTFADLDDTESPQYQALKWISLEMSRQGGAASYNQDRSLQLFALLCFYYATGGSNWAVINGGWLTTGTTECSWTGVTCDTSNIVIALNLVENGLTGSIPAEIQLLKNVQTLVLSKNSIGGSLPPSLSRVTELVELNVSSNRLVGSIPEEYGDLVLLTKFDVSENNLSGTIPSSFGSMKSLEVLNLCSNDFSGSIPSQIGSLSFLRSLNLGLNDALSGVIPDTICDLDSTFARGSIPDMIVDCSVVCECCVQCCSDDTQAASTEGCCAV